MSEADWRLEADRKLEDPRFRILSAPLPYGYDVEQFCPGGMGTAEDGFFVRFWPINGESWVGNFMCAGRYIRKVEEMPPKGRLLVFAGEHGYVIDLETRACVFDTAMKGDWFKVSELNAYVVPATRDSTAEEPFPSLMAFNSDGKLWESSDLGWLDDWTLTDRTGLTMNGGYSNGWGDYVKFVLDLTSGKVTFVNEELNRPHKGEWTQRASYREPTHGITRHEQARHSCNAPLSRQEWLNLAVVVMFVLACLWAVFVLWDLAP